MPLATPIALDTLPPAGDGPSASADRLFSADASVSTMAVPRRRLETSAANAARTSPLQRAAGSQPAARLALAPTRGPSQAAIEATVQAVAQRTVEARAPEPPAEQAVVSAPVQRAVTVNEMTVEPSAPSVGGASAGPQSEEDFERMAAKLWDRLRMQLRRELLAERERAGMLSDLH
jgi:hypothetical protein